MLRRDLTGPLRERAMDPGGSQRRQKNPRKFLSTYSNRGQDVAAILVSGRGMFERVLEVFAVFSYQHFSRAPAAKRYLQVTTTEIEVPGPRTCLAAACLRVGVAQNAMPDLHGLQRPCPPCPIHVPSAFGLQLEVRGTLRPVQVRVSAKYRQVRLALI